MAKEGKKDCVEVEPRHLLFVANKITDVLLTGHICFPSLFLRIFVHLKGKQKG